MHKTNIIHKLDSLFILLIFGVFAVVSLLLVAIGAGMYQRVVDHMQVNNQVRSSLSYVAGKIRSNDVSGAVTLQTVNGLDAICIRQTDENGVSDYIYYYNGEIKEQSLLDGVTFNPEAGDTIAKVNSFEMEYENGLYTFTAADLSGKETSIALNPRSGG